MAVRTVIFDWGGTLTPWHTVDHEALWLGVCAQHYSEAEAAEIARAIYKAERAVWQVIESSAVPPFEAAVPDATITRLSELPHYLDLW